MFPRKDPTTTKAWQELSEHYVKEIKQAHLRQFFTADTTRFKKYSLQLGDILFDYSKNIITDKTIALLQQLLEECEVPAAIEAMFSGEKINGTEGRSVLHTALRNLSGRPVMSDGKDVMPDVLRVLNQMKEFAGKIHSGEWKGYTGKPIRYIVNIGIGGSDLGPVM